MIEGQEKNKSLKRLQFDFSPDAITRIDAIKELRGAQTRAEVIRQALRFYDWLLTEVEAEDRIQVIDKDGSLRNTISARFLR